MPDLVPLYLSGDDFEKVIAGLQAQTAESEGRRVPRVQIRGMATMILDHGTASALPNPVRVRDVSRGGVGIVHHEALLSGATLTLQLPYSTGATVSLRCVVRHCRAAGSDQFFIGLGFLERKG